LIRNLVEETTLQIQFSRGRKTCCYFV